jgi:hypothetical protein
LVKALVDCEEHAIVKDADGRPLYCALCGGAVGACADIVAHMPSCPYAILDAYHLRDAVKEEGE